MDDFLPRTDDAPVTELLCFSVYSAGLAFGRVYRPLLEALGLTYVQYIVMVLLWDRDDRRVGDLCAALFLTTSTLTPVLQKLEAKGLVDRVRRPGDEREVYVVLTDAGSRLRKDAGQVSACIESATGLDASAMHELRMAISALRERLLAAPPADTGEHPSNRVQPPARKAPRRSAG